MPTTDQRARKATTPPAASVFILATGLLFASNFLVGPLEFVGNRIDEALVLVLGALALALAVRPKGPASVLVAGTVIAATLAIVAVPFNGLPPYPAALSAIVGTLLVLKLPLATLGFIALAAHGVTPLERNSVLNFLVALALINSLFVVLDMIGDGHDIWGAPLLTRNGRVIPHGLYHNKRPSAHLSMTGALAAIALGTRRPSAFLLAGFLGLVTLRHLSAIETVGVCVGSAAIVLFSSRLIDDPRRARRATLGGLAILGLALSTSSVLQHQILHYFGEAYEDRVRIVLYIVSGAIATRYFPLGSGAGTFASLPSYTTHYSPLYDYYGVSVLYGATPNYTAHLQDAFWPQILAESGWLGLSLWFGATLYTCFSATRRAVVVKDPFTSFTAAVLAATFLASFASSPYTAEHSVVLIAYLLATLTPATPQPKPSSAAAGP